MIERDLRPVLFAMLLIISLVLCAVQAVVSIRQENICWRAGYEMPVTYGGQVWCFGSGGNPRVIAIEDLSEE
jgi:hypothetical protein